jgi:prevent-host-death family protein
MKTVDVRELKSRLSEYIRRVKSGQGVLVTDRGQVVAKLTPPGQGAIYRSTSVPAGLLALGRRGLVTIGAASRSDLYPALPRSPRRRRPSARLLDEERGDR